MKCTTCCDTGFFGKSPDGEDLCCPFCGDDFAPKEEEITKEEIQKDIKLYFKFMVGGNVDGCISIEEKYGMFGGSPEMVTTHMRELIEKLG